MKKKVKNLTREELANVCEFMYCGPNEPEFNCCPFYKNKHCIVYDPDYAEKTIDIDELLSGPTHVVLED